MVISLFIKQAAIQYAIKLTKVTFIHPFQCFLLYKHVSPSETDCVSPLWNPRAGSNCISIHSNHFGISSPFNWRLGWAVSLDPAPVHRSQPRPPIYDFKGLAGDGPALRHGRRLRQEKSHIPDWLEDRPTNDAIRVNTKLKMWFKMM